MTSMAPLNSAQPPTVQKLLVAGNPWQQFLGRWLVPRNLAESIARHERYGSFAIPHLVSELLRKRNGVGTEDTLEALARTAVGPLFVATEAGMYGAIGAELATFLYALTVLTPVGSAIAGGTLSLAMGIAGAGIATLRASRAVLLQNMDRRFANDDTFPEAFRHPFGLDGRLVERRREAARAGELEIPSIGRHRNHRAPRLRRKNKTG